MLAEILAHAMSPSETKTISPRSLPKKKFTDEDDQKLRDVIAKLGTKSWVDIAAAMKDRNPRQCKERWENYLSPEINNAPWTQEEDDLLVSKQLEIGSKWVTIAKFFNHRTDAAVKNRWQLLARKMKKQNNNHHSDRQDRCVVKAAPRFAILEQSPITISSPPTPESFDIQPDVTPDFSLDWGIMDFSEPLADFDLM